MAKYHKITGNESIGTIAGMYGVDPQTLLASNPGVSTLAAGAYLRVPSVATAIKNSVVKFGNVLAGKDTYNQPQHVNSYTPGGSLAGVPLQSNNAVTSALVIGGNTPTGYQPQTGKRGIGVKGQAGGIVYDEANPRPVAQKTQGYTSPYAYQNTQAQRPSVPNSGESQATPMDSVGATPREGLNAQQIAELNLANARNTFQPSTQLLSWNQQISSGVPTPLTANMFQELTTLSVNSGVPREAAIQAVNSMLQSRGYTYNPITKGYVSTGQVGGSAPATTQTGDTTNGGQYSKDSWENYKQRTIARGGKRTWIGRGGNRSNEQAAAPTAASPTDATATGSGTANSIWRIG